MSSAIAVSRAIGFPRASRVRVRQARGHNETIWIISLCALHAPLAVLIYRVPAIALAHALLTLVVGFVLAASGRRRLVWLACWSGYVAGVEVTWRMAKAPILWEYGKYATALVLLLALVRSRLMKQRLVPIAYFALLVPSVILTFANKDADAARMAISGNLSGPFALMACGLFFSHLRLSMDSVKKLFLAVLIPTLGIAIITIYSTAAAATLVFTTNSNEITSGGFGPNQVSSALGFGVLAAWILITVTRTNLWLKVFLFGAMGLLAVQSALTFSRGGLYNAAGGALLGTVFLLKDKGSRLKVVLVLAAIVVAAVFLVLPALERFTGGALGTRFSSINTTRRSDIVMADIAIWRDYPILGLGPGMAKGTRALYYEEAGRNGAHTEFTRLLAEHGVLGLGALFLFVYAAVKNVRRSRTSKGKAITASMIFWSFLYMLNAAMRLVAPSFAFGLAFANFTPEGAPPRKGMKRHRRVHSTLRGVPGVAMDGHSPSQGNIQEHPQARPERHGEVTAQDE